MNRVLHVAICISLLQCIAHSQTLMKGANASNSSLDYVLDANLTSEECVENMRQILSPEMLGSLGNMILYSGHGINDIGNFDVCRFDHNLEYVLLKANQKETGMTLVRVGICGPKHCSKNGNYDALADALAAAVGGLTGDEQSVYGAVDVPSELNNQEMSPGAKFMIAVFISILVLWILGLIVQFTRIGDNRSLMRQEDEVKIEDRKNKIALFFYSWSPAANIEKLFTVKQGGDQRLSVLNGVRVLSICYVIVGHSFSFAQFAPITNITSFQNITDNKLFGIVAGGFYAVDAFFFLSGFLSCYLLASKMYPAKGRINIFLVYFHRYYRLIFPVLFMTAFGGWLFKYLGDGPYYYKSSEFILKPCQDYWWTNLLFINNWLPWRGDKQCIGWVWYLANDFQFFLMTPFIVMAFCKSRSIGYYASFALILICILINGLLTAIYDVSPINGSDNIDVSVFLYEKTFPRMGAYFVGAVFGFSYFELASKEKYPELEHSVANKLYNRLKNSRLTSLVVALIGAGLTALYTFPLSHYYNKCGLSGTSNCWDVLPSVLYNATCRPFYVLGIGLVIAPTFVGRLRVIRGILGNEPFAVLARLNYMVYMIHCLIIFWVINDSRQSVYMNWINQWQFSIGMMVMSFLFAIPATLMMEVPFMNIEKYILFPPKEKELNGAKNGGHYEPLNETNDTEFSLMKTANRKNNSIQ